MTAAVPPVLVPEPLRRPVAGAVVTAALVFTVLAVRLAGTSSASAVDTKVDKLVDPVAAHRWLVHHAVLLGSPNSVVLLAFALSVTCLLLGKRRLAVLAVVGPGLTGVCTTLLKPALGRTIDGVELAFPSGHTGGATALGLVAGLLAINLIRPRTSGALAILAASAVVVGGGVGAAMVATDAHYPTDTVGGFCAAVVVVCGAALVLDRLGARRSGSGV